MKASSRADFVAVERERIQLEYQRRSQEENLDLNAPWQPSAWFMLDGRNRTAAVMLHRMGVFPKSGDQCLEVGFGSLGWLSELIGWGVRESDLHGVELDPSRALKARQILPVADLRTGDAVDLPWSDGTFQLAISSTLLTSILDQNVRRLLQMKSSGSWRLAARCYGTTLPTTTRRIRMSGESARRRSDGCFPPCKEKSERLLWLRRWRDCWPAFLDAGNIPGSNTPIAHALDGRSHQEPPLVCSA